MKRELLFTLNLLLVFATGLFFCTIQSVLFHTRLLSWMHIDLILLLVVYLGMHRTPLVGGIMTIVISRMVEIHSGAPVGLLMVSYYGLFLSIIFVREFLLLQGSFSALMLSVIGGLIWKAIFAATAISIGIFDNLWIPYLQYFLPSILFVALLSSPVFRWMHYVDEITKRDQPQETVL